VANEYFEHGGSLFKIWFNADGYPCVTWGQGNERRPFLLHRLVFQLEFGQIPEGFHIHHRDENRKNWALENLVAIPAGLHRSMHFSKRYAQESKPNRWNVLALS
jgi:hypothetical protein